jgi:CHAT domain-containing protein/tetratricopeptide (TPR) repeat protein
LRPPDIFPFGVVHRGRQLIQRLGAGQGRAVLAVVISQVVEGYTIQISPHPFRVGDLPGAKLFESRDRGVLENVGCDLGIAHPPQNERAKAGKVAIDCRKVGDGVRYGSGRVRLRSEHRYGCCVIINTAHERSISRNRGTPQPRMRRRAGRFLIAAMALAGSGVPAIAADLSCTDARTAHIVAKSTLKIRGIDPATVRLRVAPRQAYLVEVEERDKDALVELLDSKNQVMARADHPERRTGTRRLMVTVGAPAIVVRVTGKEPGGMAGSGNVRLFDLAALGEGHCLAALTALAEADADYAAAEDISAGRSSSSPASARDKFLQAAAEYGAAESALTPPADRGLRGEAALALAGVEYFDLQDWAHAAQWAEKAAGLLRSDDPYRAARAEGLLAASWIEILRTPSAQPPAPGNADRPAELLVRARELLERLRRFHQVRGERYDAALELTYIVNTYTYEGRYRECLTAAADASREFDAIHETVRRAQAWQNQSLCLWGLGRLPEALRGFERALRDISPEPYPFIYVLAITNTALADFALGRFDESLRLYDRALAFTEKIQSRRSEAYCLYGIGMNYYALGDRDRAREFLERSLAIRTVALDSRGRLASLRALAPVYADLRAMDKALAADREALGLAIAPSTVARLEIQLAAHTASEGHLTEAKVQLDEVISRGVKSDPTIQAEALLQRAVLLRQMHLPHQALSDLEAARPGLHAFGNVTKEFEADLELARTLRITGQPDAALRAVDRALRYADAVRLQSANPELRAQLQTPLRPAYDLKLALLRGQYERAVAAGRDGEASALAAAAFATADAARARTFDDVAAQRYPPALRQALAPEFHRREVLYRELAARRGTLETRLESPGSAEDPRAQQLIAEIDELEREVDTVNTLIATRAGAREGTGRERSNLPALPADTALVSYWLGAESTYAWVVLPKAIHWSRLSPPATITAQAESFHHSLTRLVDLPVERRLRDSRALYQMIVKPLEPWISDLKRWAIVPDGALDYVPFAALQASDGSFVVMRHDIALAPAAWTLDVRRIHERLPAPRGLLLVADPVYQADDPRMVGVNHRSATSPSRARIPDDPTRREYQRLPFTGEEALRISAQFPRADVDQLIGLDATRERLLSLDWSAYRFIHIATHGVVDAQVPQLSALILGSYDAGGKVADDAVRVADLSLRTLTADVVVLSACETALGKEIRSEGLVGLGSTMLARGARAVVASLWPVSDEIGERLMTDFYRHLLHDSLSPETALGAAVRAVASRDRSADPALWAAFQVSVAALGPSLPNHRSVETTRVATRTTH